MEKIQAEIALTGFCIPWVPQLLKFKPFGKGWDGVLRCSLTGIGLGMYAAMVTLLSPVSYPLFPSFLSVWANSVSILLGFYLFSLLHNFLVHTL